MEKIESERASEKRIQAARLPYLCVFIAPCNAYANDCYTLLQLHPTSIQEVAHPEAASEDHGLQSAVPFARVF